MSIPENTSARPMEAHLLGAMSDGRSGYITGMEAAGQRQLVASTSLPASMTPAEDDYLAVGFTFGPADESDPLFRPATLPAGWRKKASDHNMWSDVVDDLGRRRVAVFYKAAFYDRRASMQLIPLDGYARELLANGAPPVYDDTWCTPKALYDVLGSHRQNLAEAERSYADRSEDWAVAELARVRKEMAAVDRLAASVLDLDSGDVR